MRKSLGDSWVGEGNLMAHSGIHCLSFLLQRATISEVIMNSLLFEQVLDGGYLENVKIRCFNPETFLPEN